LSTHSGYERNYLLEAFQEAIQAKPADCLVGLDFNYRGTLWSPAQCAQVMTPLVTDHVDVLITTIEDMAKIYGTGCGKLSAEAIVNGDIDRLEDEDIQAAMDAQGHFYRSAQVRSIVLKDRLGGGDTWNSGFYYGLLTEAGRATAIQKGVLVGDAATRLKQTLMYDLPIVTKQEIQALMQADVAGGGKRTAR
jgi:2-dehydro-3-deoxygluconokinase